ncbi:sulfate reduction electron transfer complex DsrMKJOP subunit DsrM [Desulfobulbus rhabdoformis]|jgi:nitrate reductase gamma subunit|uniref:sulfate reduction electron transfer complex DsrMKJOP subunit DsrM n=1 Tax=Desulfobulbus rhabdoformis TaxID=34032 RepID=UPI001963D6A4|nr:sulfate reduction electron transfer complex DsrMKJOP subunit DsrM [Desulfobulbus rhabdoformis]MBM9616113.1 sulfate reduction electron transfer complex DsrMKJOP subunit DsrM [Desulfobulbus rhabdoformis]
MKYAFPLAAVIALVLIALIAVQIPGMQYLFGVVVPYLAMALFLGGFCYRVIHWAKSPVPFRIPTTCGQGYTMPWIKYDKLEAPVNTGQVVARMFLEIFLFRSLWRNTKATVYSGPKLTYESSKWLWLFGILFHYSFLVIIIRHMRLFLDPIPGIVSFIETGDSLLQIGAPVMYTTDVTIILAILFLFARRVFNPQVRYISLVNDYFPLFLIFGICTTGILMRFFIRTDVDINAIKQLAVGLVTFSPTIVADISSLFYVHLFLVCTLLAYFPFSKLMHMGGVFLSPTRNLANNSRMVRHINPWNPEIKPHSYAGYEDEFREDMVEQGIPVEKELPAQGE